MEHITLPITTFTALILGMVYMMQTWSVIQSRYRGKIVLGDGGDRAVQKRIRGHANMAEQAPIFLILLFLVELQACANTTLLYTLVALFLSGRIMHAYYFLDIGAHYNFRRIGMLLTFIAQLLVMFSIVCTLTGGTISS
jgi:uncharacterized membrane protein YecN with MAPEG domain